MKNGALAREFGHNLAESMRGAFETSRRAVENTADSAKDAFEHNAVGKFIRRRPILSIGIAFGVGYLLMRIVRHH